VQADHRTLASGVVERFTLTLSGAFKDGRCDKSRDDDQSEGEGASPFLAFDMISCLTKRRTPVAAGLRSSTFHAALVQRDVDKKRIEPASWACATCGRPFLP
jgi:hypothetical protein